MGCTLGYEIQVPTEAQIKYHCDKVQNHHHSWNQHYYPWEYPVSNFQQFKAGSLNLSNRTDKEPEPERPEDGVKATIPVSSYWRRKAGSEFDLVEVRAHKRREPLKKGHNFYPVVKDGKWTFPLNK